MRPRENRAIILAMRRFLTALFALVSICMSAARATELPSDRVFIGESKFKRMVAAAAAGNWQELPIGDRTATAGRWLVGTPYKSFTLEIDDHVETPSVNLAGLDCWTFFEVALGFARMLDQPRANWTPQTLLGYIELDRYRGGRCDGTYLSRLHYLEDWLWDNDKRGLVADLTRRLGGVPAPHMAREMTVGWRHYRYLVANPDLLAGIAEHEARISNTTMYHIPKSRVASIEKYLRNGDIIGITSRDGDGVGTSHVGLALRTKDGVLHFMHASSPRNYGKVVIDQRLSDYLYHFSANAGILVARPLR
ncbi:MAG TPA: N-acetylmuramoyl-L-alanine amidase-like domain-containing protein [Chthoniobacterales bacterium]